MPPIVDRIAGRKGLRVWGYAVLSLVVLTGSCASDETGDEPLNGAETVRAAQSLVASAAQAMVTEAKALCAAAPETEWSGDDRTALQERWLAAREHFVRIETVLGFMTNDAADRVERTYETMLLAEGPDSDPFDAQGHVGFHALERILWAESIDPTFLAQEEVLVGYAAPRSPADAAEALRFRTGVCADWVAQLDALAVATTERALTPDMLMSAIGISVQRQLLRVIPGQPGMTQSRYSKTTQRDLRHMAAGDAALFDVAAPLVAERDAVVATALRDALARLRTAYSDDDALPSPPDGWTEDGPTNNDHVATPLGQIWARLQTEQDTANPAGVHAQAEAARQLLRGVALDGLEDLVLVRSPPGFIPVDGLEDQWLERFDEGQLIFTRVFGEEAGLGPLYIRNACNECHFQDQSGERTTVDKFVALDNSGNPIDGGTFPYGITVRPAMAAGATTPVVRPSPDDETLTWQLRAAPAIFGLGYLEAIQDEAIEALAMAQSSGTDGVTGRINRVAFPPGSNPDQAFHDHSGLDEGLIGRFGLKAGSPTLDAFNALAFNTDMSLTSPLYPDELPNPDGLTDDALPGQDVTATDVNLVSDFTRGIAIPTRPAAPDGAEALFETVGCATCHVPRLPTRADYPIAALAGLDAPVYTDLLLHDMGVGLADYVADGSATGREWRTPPLIGMWLRPSFLHDGRAATLEAAIEAHAGADSEANVAATRFAELAPAERALLLEFVRGL